jgi:hypothetical protein
VPFGVSSRRIVTRDSTLAWRYVKTIRSGSLISTIRPVTMTPLGFRMKTSPPTLGEILEPSPHHLAKRSESVK